MKSILNYSKLSDYFVAKRMLWQYFIKTQLVQGRHKRERYVYRNNKAPVLLVAHIDTVQTPRLLTNGVTGAGFDNRIGVFIADQLSTDYPQYFDMLITDYEETGGSTARYFQPSHDYNFIVELDREGCDYVDYGLASDDFNSVFMDHTGIPKGIGSYTDICEMDSLEISKINLGIGVHHSHSEQSGFHKKVCDLQVSLLLDFVRVHGHTYFPHIYQHVYGRKSTNLALYAKYGFYDDRDDDSYLDESEDTCDGPYSYDNWPFLDNMSD